MSAAPEIAFAAILALAAIAAAIQAGRATGGDYLRLACALAIALALCDILAAIEAGAMLALAAALVPIASSLGATALAFALCIRLAGSPHDAFAAATLALVTLAGIAAAATGALALGFAPLFASACAMLAFSARAWRAGRRPLHGAAAAFALIAGASAYLSGGAEGRTALALFFSVALLGTSLALKPRSRLPQARASKPSRAMPRPLP